MTCGAPGHATRGINLCVRHGGVPSAAYLAALVGDPGPGPDETVADEAAAAEDFEELPDRPPVALRAYTWLFLAVTALHVALLVLDLWVLGRQDTLLRRWEADPAGADQPAGGSILDLADRVAGAVTVALWVTLLMFAVWFGLVGRAADRLGRDRRTVLRHWTYLGWRLALVPLVLYLIAEAARDETRPQDPAAFVAEALTVGHTAAMFAALRIVMLALLCAFVLVVWRRLNPRHAPSTTL
ncbi:hypothetical protein [Dactylosporangium sp. CA-092794]|uniref:hypothetical protein n=1 Tax=Dactylosporangium sp. CA-092794 TaxID=3239929 RepID=UPI003D914AD9